MCAIKLLNYHKIYEDYKFNVLLKLFSIIVLLKYLEQLKKYLYFHIIFYIIINFHEFTKIGKRFLIFFSFFSIYNCYKEIVFVLQEII